ncbi:PREDICTED: EG45-like domain containing protein [Nelumbo nucifera]|uniref:EG45-like domain containing protein n=1 Tax=Nelumbo nucifera TaxID=4432 RepID=A0A1U7ZEZ9_NELNU|nr:PREDICTED: EG45-like domain containing protein [Nelumbo nucifera]XP_019052470.1 PREDICTED: EG45-like domain containing protein [Nelumbo nucifera]
MWIHRHHQLPYLLFFVFAVLFSSSLGDVGTASLYNPPYLPTACYNNDVSQFPANNLFASAGEGIWDNGASCGRQYLVRCLSATVPGTCVQGKIIQVKIVDRAASSVSRPSRAGTTMVLSATAFGEIANVSANVINIEFQQV